MTLDPLPLEPGQHGHDFSLDFAQGEQKTKIVIALTVVMMVGEIAAGLGFGSMALLADGWHMATHAGAFGIALFSYTYARSQARNSQYSFGTGKVSILGGFASAVALGVIALMMALESLLRLIAPGQIHFDEALGVAILGLLVNLVSALVLQDDHPHHHHGHDPHDCEDHDDHDHEHPHHPDHNLRAAYLHVLADAFTSVLAIAALLAGKYLGWNWLDAIMGMVGAVVIARWAWGLIQDTSDLLLDGGVDKHTRMAILTALETDGGDRVTDLHVWHISPQHLAAALAIASPQPRSPDYYKQRLGAISRLAHITVEVHQG